MRVAYHAYKAKAGETTTTRADIQQDKMFTNDQLFFLA